MSVTHGQAGARQHVWTFAAVRHEMERVAIFSCPCIDTGSSTIQAVPGFVGNNYFCDAGPDVSFGQTSVHPSNPLWDGEGCVSATNTCCEFNNPPFFCTTLPHPTSDNIEVRMSR